MVPQRTSGRRRAGRQAARQADNHSTMLSTTSSTYFFSEDLTCRPMRSIDPVWKNERKLID